MATRGNACAVEVFQSCRDLRCLPRPAAYRRCRRNGLATMVGFADAERSHPGCRGGYATHQFLGPELLMLLPVPSGMDPVVATLFNPLAPACAGA